jgi:hypothetical protein
VIEMRKVSSGISAVSTFRAIGATAAAVLLVACGSEGPGSGTDPGSGGQPSMTPSNPSSEPSSPSGEPGSPSATPGGPVADQAKADLAKRLGVDAAAVRVVSSEEVTWPDGSMGCPEPGMNYTQALVPGTRTVLEAAGKQYHYHSGRNGRPFLCEQPRTPTR